jgi:hypothetical protein
MTYQTAGAFRRALETRLVAQGAQTGAPLVRLRKLVALRAACQHSVAIGG